MTVFNDALHKLETVIEPKPFIGGTEPCLADCGIPVTPRMGEDIFSHLGDGVIFSKKVSIWMAALEAHSVIRNEVQKKSEKRCLNGCSSFNKWSMKPGSFILNAPWPN